MTDDPASSPSSEGERMRGSYPGGPSKREADDAESRRATGRTRLTRAEEMEARAHEGRRARIRRRRRKRLIVGFAVAIVVAGAAGFWMGLQSHRTAEEIAAEQERRQREQFDFGAESDRLLQQLWLMEDLERARKP